MNKKTKTQINDDLIQTLNQVIILSNPRRWISDKLWGRLTNYSAY